MSSRNFVLPALMISLVGCDSSSPVKPTEPATREACFARAEFDPPAQSPYCLPFAEGDAYEVTQSFARVIPGQYRIPPLLNCNR